MRDGLCGLAKPANSQSVPRMTVPKRNGPSPGDRLGPGGFYYARAEVAGGRHPMTIRRGERFPIELRSPRALACQVSALLPHPRPRPVANQAGPCIVLALPPFRTGFLLLQTARL